VTAGKVDVEVIKHYRGKKAERIAKKVALDKNEALVVFDLEGGRRKEPLEKQQLANAVNAQVAVGQQVLAQQLGAAQDPAALASYAASRGYLTTPGQIPFLRGGAVGYQPVIITLPEGANLAATAVVSADRRYVRITAVPLFSGVAEVNTFNSASGQSAAGRGGTGGRGYSDLFQNNPGVNDQGQ
jgi:hypothetical protein